MIYIEIKDSDIISTSVEYIEGFIEYESSIEDDVLINPFKYKYENGEVKEVLDYPYPDRPVRVELKHADITALQLSEYSSLISVALNVSVPKRIDNEKVIMWFEYLGTDDLDGEQIKSILENQFGAKINFRN